MSWTKTRYYSVSAEIGEVFVVTDGEDGGDCVVGYEELVCVQTEEISGAVAGLTADEADELALKLIRLAQELRSK